MKKLCAKKGFTLTEMLIAVLLLGFVSLMVTAMTSVILNSTITMREVAQAEILGSEALDNLQSRLRVAAKVTVGENGVTFALDSANPGYTLALDKEGKIVLGTGTDGTLTGDGDLLFAGSTYGELSIRDLKFSLSEGDASSVAISLSVAHGEKVLWKGNVSVKPLNGISSSSS